MSRIGKKPIDVPAGVEVKMTSGEITVKGPKGVLKFTPHPRLEIKIEEKTILVNRKSEEILDKSLHGLTRTLVANMVTGVTEGFAKKLELHGVGYRAAVQANKLQLALGYSHPVEYPAPEGIHFEIDKEKKNIVVISGIDKTLVGQVAANIRALRPPEPYKGKGIHYLGEKIRRKAGKAATAAGKGA